MKPRLLLHWTIHPFRNSPLRGGVVALFLSFVLSVGHSQWQNPVLTLVAFFFFLTTLAPFYLPTRYYLTDQEVVVRNLFTRRIRWQKWKSWKKTEKGFFLNPYARFHFRAYYQGLFLDVPPHLREAVENLLKQYIGEDSS